MKIGCPHCRKQLRASADHAGKKVRCPGCRGVFRIPSLDAESQWNASAPSSGPAVPDTAPADTAATDGKAQKGAVDAAPDEDRNGAASGPPPSRADAPLARVYIADDSRTTRKMLKIILHELNFNVIGEAANGQEAVEAYGEHKPDLMFLDINMPYKTGHEALSEIMNVDPDAAVVMLTSVSNRASVEECLEKGALNYIRKDTPMDVLKSYISETWQELNFAT